MDIGIYYEATEGKMAKELHNFLQCHNFASQLNSVQSYPIAHIMIFFLLKISTKHDLAFLEITKNSKGYHWISKELKIKHIQEECRNIYPVFLTLNEVPSWWNDSEQKFITISNLEEDLQKILSSST